MTSPSSLLLATALPSSMMLAYLAMHVTEGWQLIVLVLLGAGFVASWMRRSMLLLAASYVLTVGLCGWVVVVNLRQRPEPVGMGKAATHIPVGHGHQALGAFPI